MGRLGGAPLTSASPVRERGYLVVGSVRFYWILLSGAITGFVSPIGWT
jgi:hypothetical protein